MSNENETKTEVAEASPISDVLRSQWIAQPEDTIGGWCVTLAIPSTPAQGNPPIADFCTQEVAEHVARLHNAHLGRLGLNAETSAPSGHQPVGIRSTDVGPFVKCSCGNNPTPKHWLETHWPGDRAEGMRLVDELVAREIGAQ